MYPVGRVFAIALHQSKIVFALALFLGGSASHVLAQQSSPPVQQPPPSNPKAQQPSGMGGISSAGTSGPESTNPPAVMGRFWAS